MGSSSVGGFEGFFIGMVFFSGAVTDAFGRDEPKPLFGVRRFFRLGRLLTTGSSVTLCLVDESRFSSTRLDLKSV